MLRFLKKAFLPIASLKNQIASLFGKEKENPFDRLEQILYEADLGAKEALELTEYLKKKKATQENCIPLLKEKLLSLFPPSEEPVLEKPHVILVVGTNGSGKTTSIAKLASHFAAKGKKVFLAAGDTFRAAAIEQLKTWGEKIGIDVIASKTGGDPSAVAFDAISSAMAKGADIVLIDTAGRLQTKTDLMQELEKIKRVCQKKIETAPHETLLVLDATIGQNGIDQAKTFHAHTPLTGIILTKLDGSAKGGIAVAIQRELNIPIRWIGTGEGAHDFSPFDKQSYIDSLFA